MYRKYSKSYTYELTVHNLSLQNHVMIMSSSTFFIFSSFFNIGFPYKLRLTLAPFIGFPHFQIALVPGDL